MDAATYIWWWIIPTGSGIPFGQQLYIFEDGQQYLFEDGVEFLFNN